jgi:hypothetical protein
MGGIMRNFVPVAVSAYLVTGLGCGGGGAPAGDPISAEDGAALCDDFGAHADACGWGGNVNQADWNCGDASVVWREDVFREFVACAVALACDGDGASCYQAIAGTEPLEPHQTYATTCTEQSAACDLTPAGDSSTLLLSCNADALALYATPVIDEVLDCFAQPCADIVPCLDTVL